MPDGLLINVIGSLTAVPLRILYFFCSCPITQQLGMYSYSCHCKLTRLSTSSWNNCFSSSSYIDEGISNLAPQIASSSLVLNPPSAKMTSPCSVWSKNPHSCMTTLSGATSASSNICIVFMSFQVGCYQYLHVFPLSVILSSGRKEEEPADDVLDLYVTGSGENLQIPSKSRFYILVTREYEHLVLSVSYSAL